jgi:hypothetical protein
MTSPPDDFETYVRVLAERAASRIVHMLDQGAESVDWTTEELIGLQVHISNLFSDATKLAYGARPLPPLVSEYRQQCDDLVMLGCEILRKLRTLKAGVNDPDMTTGRG